MRATLVVRARGRARTTVARYATRPDDDVAMMTTLAAALTPAALERVVHGLRFGWRHEQGADAAQTRLAMLLRAFTTSRRVVTVVSSTGRPHAP